MTNTTNDSADTRAMGTSAVTEEQIFDLVGEVLGQPLIAEDLREGFTVHTEPRDWVNFARALLAASQAEKKGESQ